MIHRNRFTRLFVASLFALAATNPTMALQDNTGTGTGTELVPYSNFVAQGSSQAKVVDLGIRLIGNNPVAWNNVAYTGESGYGFANNTLGGRGSTFNSSNALTRTWGRDVPIFTGASFLDGVTFNNPTALDDTYHNNQATLGLTDLVPRFGSTFTGDVPIAWDVNGIVVKDDDFLVNNNVLREPGFAVVLNNRNDFNLGGVPFSLGNVALVRLDDEAFTGVGQPDFLVHNLGDQSIGNVTKAFGPPFNWTGTNDVTAHPPDVTYSLLHR